jgi:hypothetical protein
LDGNRKDSISNKGDYSDGNKPSFKGGKQTMTTQMPTNDKLFAADIVGMRSLRSNLSEYVSKSINNFQEILIANTAVKGSKTVSIIATDLIQELLGNYSFSASVVYDDVTKQYEAEIPEIDANGCGSTRDEAIEVLVDNVIMLTEDYFENTEVYMKFENHRKMYPYYMKIKHCKTRDELVKMLGLN